MNNLILSINVVLPLFLLMGLGYFLKFSKLLDEQWLKKANILVFKVFLPMLLFINIYQTDLHKVLNPRLMVFIFLVEIAIFLILLLLIPHLENNPLRKGVLIQGIYRSNYIIFGIPVTINLFGPSAAGSAAIITILVIPMFNIFAVLVLKMYSDSKTNAKNVLQEIIS
ncbi:MAG: AEC family transporter, partial [Clostridiales bacterium]